MFTKENGKLALTVFIAASLALIVHQSWTAPRIAKAQAPKKA